MASFIVWRPLTLLGDAMNRRSFLLPLGATAVGFAQNPPAQQPANSGIISRRQRVAPRSHAVLPEQGDSWTMAPARTMTFKLFSNETGGSVSAFEEIVPPGEGTPLHIHRSSDEVIYLLEGELTLRLGSEISTISAGSWVFIAQGSVHGWKNRGKAPVRASYLFTPSDGGRVFEEARHLGPIPSANPVTMAKFSVLCKRYGYDLVSLDWD
jgi:quercetin dioxygenase-like cupin family protein